MPELFQAQGISPAERRRLTPGKQMPLSFMLFNLLMKVKLKAVFLFWSSRFKRVDVCQQSMKLKGWVNWTQLFSRLRAHIDLNSCRYRPPSSSMPSSTVACYQLLLLNHLGCSYLFKILQKLCCNISSFSIFALIFACCLIDAQISIQVDFLGTEDV